RHLGHPSTIRATDRKLMTVKVDRVVGHGEVCDAHARTIIQSYWQDIDAGEHAAVPRPHVEIGHLVDLRQIGAGVDEIAAHDEDEVAIDGAEGGIARVHDEHAHHTHRHLHHLVGMRVIHEGPASLQLELVDEGLAGLDVGLGQPADAIHAARHDQAVPGH